MDNFNIKRNKIFIFGLVLLLAFPPLFLHSVLADSSTNFQIEIIPGPQCYDGQDNDGDGLIDFPNDPDCDSTSDNSEAPPAPPGGGGSGGSGSSGGGGETITPVTGVTFSGRAYPMSKVTVLKDGQIAITTIAGPDANFDVSLTGLSPGNYTFSVYGEDDSLRRSTLFTFSVFITKGATTNISGIFLSPTIDVNKTEVKKGDNIAIFGQSSPDSEITISVNSDKERFVKTDSDENGVYLYNLDTSPLGVEQHFVKSKSAYENGISSFGKSVGFRVGTKNIARVPKKFMRGDLNDDGRVNIVDFSIAAYWYKRQISANFIAKEAERLNDDGKINLIDFSIMAFYWTG